MTWIICTRLRTNKSRPTNHSWRQRASHRNESTITARWPRQAVTSRDLSKRPLKCSDRTISETVTRLWCMSHATSARLMTTCGTCKMPYRQGTISTRWTIMRSDRRPGTLAWSNRLNKRNLYRLWCMNKLLTARAVCRGRSSEHWKIKLSRISQINR